MANTRNPMMVKGTPPVMNASLQRASAQPPTRGLNNARNMAIHASLTQPMRLATGGIVHLPRAFAAGAQRWGHTPHFNSFLHAYSNGIRNRTGKRVGFTKVGKVGKGGKVGGFGPVGSGGLLGA